MVKRRFQRKTHPACLLYKGTLEYMPPEFINSYIYDYKSEWWTFGCFLYEIHVGKAPFHYKDENRLVSAIQYSDPDYS